MLSKSFGHKILLATGVLASCLMAAAGAGASPFSPLKSDVLSSAHAPLVTKVQMTDQSARSLLRSLAYRDINIIQRKNGRLIIRACKTGKQWRLVVDQRGIIIRRKVLGACGGRAPAPRVKAPRKLSLPQIRARLQSSGFRDIRFTDRRLPVYVATACRNNNRMQLRISARGRINDRRKIGRCGAPQRTGKSPGQVRDDLERRGFSRIDFVDRQLPNYVVNACRGSKRMRLNISGAGKIKTRRKIGNCGGAKTTGKSPGQVRDDLERRGFSRIDFVDRRLPNYVVNACRGSKRMRLNISGTGKIKTRRQIGNCGPAKPKGKSTSEIRNLLRGRGFSKIDFIDRRLPNYVVSACRNAKRMRLVITGKGKVTKRRQIGSCGVKRSSGKSPAEVRSNLRSRGFSQIEFIDRRLPKYIVRACQNQRRYRMTIAATGRIKSRKDVGSCRRFGGGGGASGVTPSEVRDRMQGKGFYRITFIDRRLPTYVVRACKDDRRMELRINSSGRTIDRQRIGRCSVVRSGMKPPAVRRSLQARGFSRILFTDHQLPVYVVEACRHGRKFELRVDRYARVMNRRDFGSCHGRRHMDRGYELSQVRDILRSRGYGDIDFYDRSLPRYGVIACRRGQKFRMGLNRFAEIKNRRRIGFCRPPERAPEPTISFHLDVDEEEIDDTSEIGPETCQTYLETLVSRNRIHFDVASASLRSKSYRLLERLARVMNRCTESRIEISGHTDSDGSREYNRELSRQRARSVVGFLTEEGISVRRMTAYGYGEDQPLMRYERTSRDKARNRRIDFTVIWGDDDF